MPYDSDSDSFGLMGIIAAVGYSQSSRYRPVNERLLGSTKVDWLPPRDLVLLSHVLEHNVIKGWLVTPLVWADYQRTFGMTE